jgi:hypothetical protein
MLLINGIPYDLAKITKVDLKLIFETCLKYDLNYKIVRG